MTAGPGAHGRKVADMFGRIVGWYDFLNHFLSLGQDIAWRKRLVTAALAHRPDRVLDLAAGTLDVTRELLARDPGIEVLSVDFSLPMLARGWERKMGGGRKSRCRAVCGDGLALPMADDSVSAATIAFGIRNIRPRQGAYGELLRVLSPGGRLCILEFGSAKKRIVGGLYNFYLDRLLPLAGRIVSGDSEAYSYLADTIREFPPERELARELLDVGFKRVYFAPLAFGVVYLHVAEAPGEGDVKGK